MVRQASPLYLGPVREHTPYWLLKFWAQGQEYAFSTIGFGSKPIKKQNKYGIILVDNKISAEAEIPLGVQHVL